MGANLPAVPSRWESGRLIARANSIFLIDLHKNGERRRTPAPVVGAADRIVGVDVGGALRAIAAQLGIGTGTAIRAIQNGGVA